MQAKIVEVEESWRGIRSDSVGFGRRVFEVTTIQASKVRLQIQG